MHVSILYGVLLFLLKPMERRRAGKWTVAILSLSLLWMYGFVTGLTPSVLRAVTMFSFVAVAKPLGRSGSILNTLAASAFVLILFDPWLICAAGFQLSYLAVLGIVLLYRPIYHLMEFRWAWADWIWQITCVSIAAQVATLPVTLYYFHQFPPWFLLANLFVIPASTIILLGGILLLLFSPLSLVAGWIARGLEWMIWLLNEGLFMVGELPFSLVFPIPITFLQALCLGAMIIGVFGFFRTKKFHWMWLVLSLAIIYSLEDWRLRFDNESEFVVYRVPGQVGIEWQVNQQSLAVLDSSLVADTRKVSFHLLPHRVARRIQKTQTLAPDQDGSYFVVEGLHFLRIASPGFVPPDHLETDYLIIGNNAVPSLETLNRTLTFDQVILDSSNSLRYTERLASEAEKLGVSCHSVLQQGAFVLSMKN
jgi:competence protein ComEC